VEDLAGGSAEDLAEGWVVGLVVEGWVGGLGEGWPQEEELCPHPPRTHS
jgi:hypothetical protein